MHQVKNKIWKVLMVVFFLIFGFYFFESIAIISSANQIHSAYFAGTQYISKDERDTVLFNSDGETGTILIMKDDPVSFSFYFQVEYGLMTFNHQTSDKEFQGLVLDGGQSIFINEYGLILMKVTNEIIH